MKVIFRTNLDNYNYQLPFPNSHFYQVPRIGDSVEVKKDLKEFFQNRKLPTSLRVVDVLWTEDAVICELWYKQIDVEAAKISGINLF